MSLQGSQRRGLAAASSLGLAILALLTGCQQASSPEGHPLKQHQKITRMGSAETSIINGKDADGSEIFARSVVGLAARTSRGIQIFCTGTLISEDTVVTAAHCLEGISGISIAFGLNQKGILQLRTVVRSAYHDKYSSHFPDSARDIHDIGIAQFSGGLPSGYQPATILPDERVLKNGANVLLAGYGVNDGVNQVGSGKLRYTRVPIAEANYGANEIRTDEHSSGSCNGDSGGPGFVMVGGTYYVWGTTSRGDANCRQEGIYTKVTAYRKWIETRMAMWAASPSSIESQEESVEIASGF